MTQPSSDPPLPTPISPLKAMRESLGMTMDTLASATGTSHSFIVRAEQCCYAEPPDVLMDYLLDRVDDGFVIGKEEPLWIIEDESDVLEAWLMYQKLTRIANYGKLNPHYNVRVTGLDQHPFIAWRTISGITSRVAIARLYCVHPAIMFKFECQIHRMMSVPESLRKALLESGYSTETLDRLDFAYQNHRRFMRNLNLGST